MHHYTGKGWSNFDSANVSVVLGQEEEMNRTLDRAIEAARSMKRTTDRMAKSLSADLAKAQLHRRQQQHARPLGDRRGNALWNRRPTEALCQVDRISLPWQPLEQQLKGQPSGSLYSNKRVLLHTSVVKHQYQLGFCMLFVKELGPSNS